jgi:hypothetical protein
MAYLGTFQVAQPITFRVTWTVAEETPAPTASSLLLEHERSDRTVGPIVGQADGTNAWKAVATLPAVGRWRVHWITTPAGGRTDDSIYVE